MVRRAAGAHQRAGQRGALPFRDRRRRRSAPVAFRRGPHSRILAGSLATRRTDQGAETMGRAAHYVSGRAGRGPANGPGWRTGRRPPPLPAGISRHQQVAADQATVLEACARNSSPTCSRFFDHRSPSNGHRAAPRTEFIPFPSSSWKCHRTPVLPSRHRLRARRLPAAPAHGPGSTRCGHDMTGTLPFARREADITRRVRAGRRVAEPFLGGRASGRNAGR